MRSAHGYMRFLFVIVRLWFIRSFFTTFIHSKRHLVAVQWKCGKESKRDGICYQRDTYPDQEIVMNKRICETKTCPISHLVKNNRRTHKLGQSNEKAYVSTSYEWLGPWPVSNVGYICLLGIYLTEMRSSCFQPWFWDGVQLSPEWDKTFDSKFCTCGTGELYSYTKQSI